MRARWGTIAGAALLAAYVTLMALVVIDTPQDRAPEEPAASEAGAAEAFVAAWERSRTSTYLTEGTFERRSEVTGASIASEDVVVQRPPRRIHRQLGGVDGRDDGRLLVCPAPPPGEDEPEPCRYGPEGRSYDSSVRREVEGVRSIVTGGDPLYTVTSPADGCFVLDLRRSDPRAPFGIGATFCFDAATGAPIRSEVRYAEGINEVVVVDRVTAEVTDADLEP